jgi:hypothetical protein
MSPLPTVVAELVNKLQALGIAFNRVWLRVTPPSVVTSSPGDACGDAPATPVPQQPLPRSKQAATPAAPAPSAAGASSSRAAPQPQEHPGRSTSTGKPLSNTPVHAPAVA